MNNFDYKNLTPFKWFVLENFPFIENDFDAINDYHLFSKVVEYLNKTIDNMNLTGEQMENVTNAMTELQNYVNNYFDNLDVQNEINNKLDSMVQSGELQEIVSNIFDILNTKIDDNETETNLKINNINNRIDVLSSGSPAGVYATTQDLINANPDHSKIYVVSADGQWYYYNTTLSQWTAGGLYQTAQNTTGISQLVKDIEPLQNGYRFLEHTYIASNGSIASINTIDLYCFKVIPGQTLIEIKTTGTFFYYGFFVNEPSIGSVSYNNTRVYNQTKSKCQIEIPNGVNWIAISTTTGDVITIKPQNVIDSLRLNSKTIQETLESYNNILNDVVIENGYLLYYETGERFTNDTYSTTDYIDIDSDKYYKIFSIASHVCLWDADKHFLSGFIIAPGSYSTKKINFGSAKYVTLSIQTANIPNCYFGVLDLPGYKKPYFYGYLYKDIDIPSSRSLTNVNTKTTACLKLPPKYTQYGKPTKLCIIVHGASKGIAESGNSWTLDAGYNSIVNALSGIDCAVMDINGYGNGGTTYNHWGCSQAISAYVKAYEYFIKNYNLDPEVYVYGFSMGGLTALTLGIQKIIPIKAMMIGCPVISLYDQCVEMPGEIRQDFLDAYQMENYDTDILKGYDRLGDIIKIGNIDYNFKINLPLFIAYGTTDENVSNQYIQDYYNSLKNSNCNTIIQGFTGGHEVCYGGSQDLLVAMNRFFTRY